MSNPHQAEKRIKTPEPAVRYPNRQLQALIREHQEENRIRLEQERIQRAEQQIRQAEAEQIRQQQQERRSRNSTRANNTGMGRGVEEDDKPVIKFNGGKTGKKRKLNKKHRSRKYNKK
jgi:hypothetical protein